MYAANAERFRPHGYGSTPAFSFADVGPVMRVVDVHDGDTIKVVMEVFPGRFFKSSLRLAGIDACEITSHDAAVHARAVDARTRLLQLITRLGPETVPYRTHFQIQTLLASEVFLVRAVVHGVDKYGRVLADVYPIGPASDGGPESLSAVLLREKLVMPYDGGRMVAEADQLDSMA